MARARKQTEPVLDAIRLISPHGFIDSAGEHRYWPAGQVVTDPETIALLIERGATIEKEEADGLE